MVRSNVRESAVRKNLWRRHKRSVTVAHNDTPMAKSKLKLLFPGLGALVFGAAAVYLWTSQNIPDRLVDQRTTHQRELVDPRSLRTARALVSLASTAEEQQYALEAVRIANDEVDLAFAAALLDAQVNPPALSPESKEINARIQNAQIRIQSGQQEIHRLEASAKSSNKNGKQEILDRLDLAKAQLELDQDEMEDARQDLIRSGGDIVARIQEMLKQHESVEHGTSSSPAPQIKPSSFLVAGATLESHLEDWWQLHSKEKQLTEARVEAMNVASAIQIKGNTAKQRSSGSPLSSKHPRNLSSKELEAKDFQRKNQQIVANYQHRSLDLNELDKTYTAWNGIVANEIRIVKHAVLGSVLLILVILLGTVAALRLVDRLYGESGAQDRRLLTTRVAYRSAIQAIGLVFVLLAVFGIPNQVATVLALAGAGLTVVLKDFIVGFFGWFTLMGRDGIRVGDWVEINGIGGEVVEIGLLRTVLFETGNWNDAGHPTGRKVAFVNSFAIEGHYFNFTTSGQWLWDEINIPIPTSEDPYVLTEAIRKIVDRETASYASSAEEEWQKATHNVPTKAFSTAPAVDVRPTSSGMSLMVRYITQATGRRELRSRLYQAIVSLLYEKGLSRSGSKGDPQRESA